jgi:hypothetical protein
MSAISRSIDQLVMPADDDKTAQSATFPLAHPHDHFPKPQLTTMTIARTNSIGFTAIARVPLGRQTSIDSNPMMRVTLPKEFGDDPLSSPLGDLPMPAFFNATETEEVKQPEPEPEVEQTQKSSGFANVFTRRRQSSIEKKPPMAPTPTLRRSTSVPMKHAFSKMAPMLKRVVSGNKSRGTFPEDEEEEEEEDRNQQRESLLMLMRVPEIERVSLVPLMMASDMDY